MRGRDMVALGREGFLAIAPPFTGDILWEHLEILQKGMYIFRERENCTNNKSLLLYEQQIQFDVWLIHGWNQGRQVDEIN